MSKLFISGGTVIDPETLSRFQADVLCEDGRIAAVQPAQSGAPKDARVIDASGCFVCPGFIDPHGHIDGCKYTGTLSLLQGITTTVGGNCGFSPLDIDAFLRSQTAFPIHQAEMIGLCALREAAGVTDLFAPAKRAQVHTMEALCERALQSGAAGVSLGPGYAPGTSLEEMEALCTMARRYGRPAAIDTRMFAMTDLNSLSEADKLFSLEFLLLNWQLKCCSVFCIIVIIQRDYYFNVATRIVQSNTLLRANAFCTYRNLLRVSR